MTRRRDKNRSSCIHWKWTEKRPTELGTERTVNGHNADQFVAQVSSLPVRQGTESGRIGRQESCATAIQAEAIKWKSKVTEKQN